MKTDLLQSCGHCWVFQICRHIECSTTASSLVLNSSGGIPSPPLALFVAMLPKAHLTSYSRMSGSRWVITPSWLSGSWRTTAQLHSSPMLAKWCSKFSKPGFNSTWTVNFQMFKLDLEKGEEPQIKLPTSVGSLKNKRVLEKHLFLLYWLCQSLWLCGSQQTVENSERDGNTRPPYLLLEKSVCRSKSNS